MGHFGYCINAEWQRVVDGEHELYTKERKYYEKKNYVFIINNDFRTFTCWMWQ